MSQTNPAKERAHHVGVRLTRIEREILGEAAHWEGLTVSAFVRGAALRAAWSAVVDPAGHADRRFEPDSEANRVAAGVVGGP